MGWEPTKYEHRQAHNKITAWLHNFRYKHAIREARELASPLPLQVIDIGCGTTKLFDVLNEHVSLDYTGIDIEPKRLETARARHIDRTDYDLICSDVLDGLFQVETADIIFALETFEHLHGRTVIRILERISEIAPKKLICTVPVEIGPAIWMKNIGSALCGYIRHHEYTWRETFWAGLYRLDKVQYHGGPCIFGFDYTIGHRGFDWRWLAQSIHQQMNLAKIVKFPVPFLPAAVSTSVMIVSTPRS